MQNNICWLTVSRVVIMYVLVVYLFNIIQYICSIKCPKNSFAYKAFKNPTKKCSQIGLVW